MMQRVPNYYDNIVEDHSYTMFSTYPPTTNVVDHWQIVQTKDENAMVRVLLIFIIQFRAEHWIFATDVHRLFIVFVHRLFLSYIRHVTT